MLKRNQSRGCRLPLQIGEKIQGFSASEQIASTQFNHLTDARGLKNAEPQQNAIPIYFSPLVAFKKHMGFFRAAPMSMGQKCRVKLEAKAVMRMVRKDSISVYGVPEKM